jgi:hypothetical protein
MHRARASNIFWVSGIVLGEFSPAHGESCRESTSLVPNRGCLPHNLVLDSASPSYGREYHVDVRKLQNETRFGPIISGRSVRQVLMHHLTPHMFCLDRLLTDQL